MIQKLIARYRDKKLEKERNKPKYYVDELYVGELIHIVDKKYVGPNTNTTYRINKKFVILASHGFASYRHIKSGQIIRSSFIAPIGDFAIHKEDKFSEKFPLLVRRLGLDDKSKLSENVIVSLENGLNNGSINYVQGADAIMF